LRPDPLPSPILAKFELGSGRLWQPFGLLEVDKDASRSLLMSEFWVSGARRSARHRDGRRTRSAPFVSVRSVTGFSLVDV